MANLPVFDDSEMTAFIVDVFTGESTPLTNFTSYTLDSDFFIPSDAGTFIVEETDQNILKNIKVGKRFDAYVNGTKQFEGFISSADLSRDVGSGRKISIKCHDILHTVANSYIRSTTKFTKNTTLKQALEIIFEPFGITDIVTDDSANLSLASGGKIGIKTKGKTPKGRQKSLKNSINNTLHPKINEGVMEYAKRICDMYGMNIKLVPGTKQLLVSSPIYNRKSDILYKINLIDNDLNSNSQSYTHSAKVDQCPSMIIGECVDKGKVSSKVIYVSEIFGYDFSKGFSQQGFTDSVKKEVDNLIKNKKGYLIIDPNIDFTINGLTDQIRDILSPRQFAQVLEYRSDSAKTQEQLIFETSKKMYDYQHDVFTLDYTVRGHEDFDSRAIYNCNNLIQVTNLYGRKISPILFWIKKRTFTKSVSEGTKTKLELKLSYNYDFNIED